MTLALEMDRKYAEGVAKAETVVGMLQEKLSIDI